MASSPEHTGQDSEVRTFQLIGVTGHMCQDHVYLLQNTSSSDQGEAQGPVGRRRVRFYLSVNIFSGLFGVFFFRVFSMFMSNINVPQREDHYIDNDLLISLVQERVALWDTRERDHSDMVVLRRLWNEVAQELMDDWDNATPRARKDFLNKVRTRWLSMKDLFNKDLRLENQAHSGGAARLRKYKYHRMLAFMRPVLARRITLEPGSSSGAVLQRTASEQSQPSTSEAASRPASQAGEQAAGPSGLLLSQASSASVYVGSSRQRQKVSERTVMPESLHLSTVFQDGMKSMVDRLSSVRNHVDTLFQSVHQSLDHLEADIQRPAHHFFYGHRTGHGRKPDA
ncbi:uncharacterized protein [Dendrobates tinctorius]|uniref:uncharacterized protein n=1 Tax=Dendrobates tinctorius TaxID=92724 RepID=UPI003CC93BA4